MSVRGYFQLRWAVPGFSFILVVIGLNYLPLLEIISPSTKSEGFGVVLALLSLFTASAIGFLTTQVYWWRYNRNGEFMGISELSGIKTVLEEYGFSQKQEENKNNKKKEKEERRVIAAVLDFAVYLGAGDKLLNYVWRRWDIFHTLRTTCVALFTGALVGVGMRTYFETYLFKVHLWVPEQRESALKIYLRWENAEGVSFLLTLFAVFLLIVVLWKTSQAHIKNYWPTWEAICRKSMGECEIRVREAFPDHFGAIFCHKCTKRISIEFKVCPYCEEKLKR